MTVHPDIPELLNPAPNRGLSFAEFSPSAVRGFGDGHNSYPHSAAWFEGCLYIGTTRANMCMIKVLAGLNSNIPFWPVDCPDDVAGLYRQVDRRAQIWRFDPRNPNWECVFKAPIVEGIQGHMVPREHGYRGMAVFQGADDPKPALYVSGWATGLSPGGLILRSYDGKTFEMVSEYGILEVPTQVTRSLTVFKDRMFMSPTARRGGQGEQQNTAGQAVVFESHGPALSDWRPINESGFGDPGNLGIFTMTADDERLYAGTFNHSGMQVWATDAEGTPPYRWEKILDKGGARGAENQCVASMCVFKGDLYVGGGIQGGGYDKINDIGPAAAEILRVRRDGTVDLIVADARETETGWQAPLSGMRAGFNNFFAGYIWSMAEHDGWLYAGTYESSFHVPYVDKTVLPRKMRLMLDAVGMDRFVEEQCGCDLWRTADGENWMPVTTSGFDCPYNWGIRNITSTPHGLFVACANAYGPRVAVKNDDGKWEYQDNPRGGCEIWHGSLER